MKLVPAEVLRALDRMKSSMEFDTIAAVETVNRYVNFGLDRGVATRCRSGRPRLCCD